MEKSFHCVFNQINYEIVELKCNYFELKRVFNSAKVEQNGCGCGQVFEHMNENLQSVHPLFFFSKRTLRTPLERGGEAGKCS